MVSQAELYDRMKNALTDEAKVDYALELLDSTQSRQYLDDVLLTLRSEACLPYLNADHRDILRRKYWHYHEQPPAKDKAGMLREGITRLLVHIGHMGDEDIYQAGVTTYQPQPVTDVAQNLRAVALAGLADCNRELAVQYASRLIGEHHASVFNCEPSMTAIDVLASGNEKLVVYQFVLLRGIDFVQQAKGEAVAHAIETLLTDLPDDLIRDMIAPFIEKTDPVTCVAIISGIVDERRDSLYDVIEDILIRTDDEDLHRAGVLSLAASRDDTLTHILLNLARMTPPKFIRNQIEAIELISHDDRDEV